jgi:hypothetical protein
MALYVSAARRRRRTVVIGVLALAVGILVGVLVGRSLGSSADDEVVARQADAEQLVARLDGLDLEYQQTAGGGAGETDALQGSVDAARSIAAETPDLLARMPWVPPAERESVEALVVSVVTAVEAGAPPAEVSATVVAADTGLRAAAGIPPPAG